MAFRTMQLDLRVQEVYEAYHSFKSVVSGDMEPAVHESSADEGKAFVASVRDRVDLEDVSLTGHSFGGATVVSHPPVLDWCMCMRDTVGGSGALVCPSMWHRGCARRNAYSMVETSRPRRRIREDIPVGAKVREGDFWPSS